MSQQKTEAQQTTNQVQKNVVPQAPVAEVEAQALQALSAPTGVGLMDRAEPTIRPLQQTQVLRMQKKHGNAYVQRLLQEQQSTTEQVSLIPSPPKLNFPIQPKLTVNEPDDSYEKEADAVADAVMRTPASAPPPPIDGQNRHPDIARKTDDISGQSVAPDVESNISTIQSSGGKPLPGGERDFFESRMGADLSHIRIHDGDLAVQTARDLNAKAYTVGSDIVFNQGEYTPGTDSGRHLLAHELTHTIQQGATLQRREQTEDEAQEVSPTNANESDTATTEEARVEDDNAAEEFALGLETEVATEESETSADEANEADVEAGDSAQTNTNDSEGEEEALGEETAVSSENEEDALSPVMDDVQAEMVNNMTELDTEQQQDQEALATNQTEMDDSEFDLYDVLDTEVEFQDDFSGSLVAGRFDAVAGGNVIAQTEDDMTIATDEGSSFTDEADLFIQREPDEIDEQQIVKRLDDSQANLFKENYKTLAKEQFIQFNINSFGKLKEFIDLSKDIEPRIKKAADDAKTAVDNTVKEQKDPLVDTIKTTRTHIEQQMSGALGEVEKQNKTSLEKVAADTQGALAKLDSGKKNTLDKLNKLVNEGLKTEVDRQFQDNDAKFMDVATRLGKEADAIGDNKVKEYQNEPLDTARGALSYLFESKADVEKRAKDVKAAKISAARKTTKSYKEKMVERAKEAAQGVHKQKPTILAEAKKKLSEVGAQVEAKYIEIKGEIQGSDKAATQTLTQMLPSQLETIKAEGKKHLRVLDEQEKFIKTIDDIGAERKKRIDAYATKTAKDLQLGANTLIQNAVKQLKEVTAQTGLNGIPNLAMLETELQELLINLMTTIDKALPKLEEDIGKAEGTLQGMQQAGVEDIQKVGKPANEKASAVKGDFDTSFTEIKASILKVITDIEKKHTETSGKADKAVTDFESILQQATTSAFKEIKTLLEQATKDSIRDLETNLRKDLDSLASTIEEEAKKAADAVAQPFWKSVANFVIGMVVTVVVGIAIVALVAALPLTGAAFIIASIGVAVAVGVLGGLAQQAIMDGLVNGKLSSPETYLIEAGKGAINGIITLAGAGAGAYLTKALQASPKLAWVATFGADGTFNSISNVAQDLADNGTIDTNVWLSIGLGFASAGLGKVKPFTDMVEGVFKRVGLKADLDWDGVVNKVRGNRASASGATPRVLASGPEVTGTGVDQPKLLNPGPEQPKLLGPGPEQPKLLNPGPEQPKLLGPGPEQPKLLGPGPEQPKLLGPGPEQPKLLGPGPEQPKLLGPGPEQPKLLGPGPEQPKLLGPGPEQPKLLGPGPEQPKLLNPGPEQPKLLGPGPEQPKLLNPGPEQPKLLGPGPEQPKLLNPGPEQPKLLGPGPEQPKLLNPAPEQAPIIYGADGLPLNRPAPTPPALLGADGKPIHGELDSNPQPLVDMYGNPIKEDDVL